jgi:hypothetical protein
MSIRLLNHIMEQDTKSNHDCTRTCQVPRGDYVYTLPYRDIRYENENDGKKVADGDHNRSPNSQ